MCLTMEINVFDAGDECMIKAFTLYFAPGQYCN